MAVTQPIPPARSITPHGKHEDFDLAVARRQVRGHVGVSRFGRNPSVGTTEESVWAYGGLYNWLATATALKVSSSSASDTSAGTGVRTVEISGLDANWLPITETVTMTGTTQATTTATFIRVFRINCLTCGTGNTNAGDIYAYTGTATAGVPNTATTVYAMAPAGEAQTLQLVHTVPDGYTGYVRGMHVFTSLPNNGVGTFRLMQRKNPTDGTTAPFRTARYIQIKDVNELYLPFKHPFQLTQRTDLELRFTISASTAEAAGVLDLLLIKGTDLTDITSDRTAGVL